MEQNKKSKAVGAAALFFFGVASALGFQALSRKEPNCEQLRGDRVLSHDETVVQRRLRSTFIIATFQWLNPVTQNSVLEQARQAEAKYPNENAGLSVRNSELKIENFLKLSPKFQTDLLTSIEQGVVLGKSAEAKSDDLTIYSYTQEATTTISSDGKCFPDFRFAR
jgi:hypothetical protein